MLDGRGLNVWGWIPGLRRLPLLGLLLRANRKARRAWQALQASAAFQTPIKWADIDVPAIMPQAWRKRSGLFRDREGDERVAFVVCDDNYLSAR